MKRWAFVLVLCVAISASLTTAAHAASFTFDVDSTLGWQPMSILMRQGQQLTFLVEGAWTVDHRYYSSVGPEGYSPEEDSQIFQGCKLNPALPYGRLLVRAGDDPSFVVIGTKEGVFMPNRDGPLSFRIHDGDGCLGDNAGSLKITITAAEFPAVARTPFFYCITGPGEGGGCQEVYKNPVPSDPFSSQPPPTWLTSSDAAKCLVPFTAELLDKLMPGLGKLEKILDIAGFYETFYSLAIQRGIPLNDAQNNPLYWKTLVDALGQHLILDSITFQDCRDWAALLP